LLLKGWERVKRLWEKIIKKAIEVREKEESWGKKEK